MTTPATHTIRPLILPALVLTVLMASVAYLSPRFVYGSAMLSRPIIPFVGAMIAAGVVYLFALGRTRTLPDSRRLLWFIIAVGLVIRLVLFASNPILEDDYYRYLWDGAVTAHGFNPYAHTPQEVLAYGGEAIPESLYDLAAEAGRVTQRVNHPGLGTVYPPVAQAAFALAFGLKPWSVLAWKAVLLLCDLLTLAVLVKILKAASLPSTYALIYWWNPILLKETYNSAHMDMLVLPFLMLAVYYIAQQRLYRSGIAVSVAVAVKLWPLILVPVYLRASRAKAPAIAKALLISTLVLILLLAPMLWAIPLGERSGLRAYGEHWEMNDALFMVVESLVRFVTQPLSFIDSPVEVIARLTIAGLLLGWVITLARKPVQGVPDLFNRLVLATGALFMLSPTQFPWYYLWVVPFLALSPRPSLLLLTPMLPLYYLKFYYTATGEEDFFHNTLVWVEYAPVLVYSAYEYFRYRLNPVPMKEEIPHA